MTLFTARRAQCERFSAKVTNKCRFAVTSVLDGALCGETAAAYAQGTME